LRAAPYWKAGCTAAITLFCFRGPAAEGVVKIEPEIAVSGVRPFGINLGFRSSWGAEQLMSNVVMNPGFEGIVDRGLIAAVPLDRYRFLDNSQWNGRSDDFWVGAEYQVRTGHAAGFTGKIVGSRKSGAQGLPEFSSDSPLPALEPGDRISLTKITDDRLPTQWWIPADSAGQVGISREPRPGSAGLRSLQLRPQLNASAEIHSYLDTIGGRAGALLPIIGKWRLAFWTRARSSASLSVKFGRNGGHTWVDRTIAVPPRWQRMVIDFDGGEDGSRGVLDLCFRASGELLLDDVELGSSRFPPAAFRHEVVETLVALHPAYLRDWQGQLGDTLGNRLAPEGARRASRYRPGGDEATDFGYSLPEFLDLCREVHANPWIVAPTTFTDAEWAGLGRFLKARSGDDRFTEILVEFGNENWNSLFSAAGIAEPDAHADAAARGFRALGDASGDLPIKAVVNAQYANPDAVAQLSTRLCFPAMIAVAPYFLRSLPATQTSANRLSALFGGDGETLQKIASAMHGPQQELGVYEINLHTTEGDASGADRAPIIAGAASGSALAIHLLDGLALGIRRQCVYVLSGFDFKLPDPLGYTPLWGVARDLGPTRRLRPTGLALAMLNKAVAGDLYKCRIPFRDLTVAPFRTRSGWSVAIASAAARPRDVRIEFPDIHDVPLPSRRLTLRASSPLATNEESELVTIASDSIAAAGRVITTHLPAYGLAVLLPEDGHER
jgi:hypothetical protein